MIRWFSFLWPSRVDEHGYLSESSRRYWLLRMRREGER